MLSQLLIFLVAILAAQNLALLARLSNANRKLDKVLETFEGLREYLYEIDPQFDDERLADEAFNESGHGLDAYHAISLESRKQDAGRRTLTSPFCRQGD